MIVNKIYSIITLMKSIISSIFSKVVDKNGDALADKVTAFVGSWKFIVYQTLVLITWICSNLYLATRMDAFDPYPFILLNLVLSFQSAFTGPIVLMSQNRQSKKDRISLLKDFECDLRTELMLTEVKAMLRNIEKKL